MLSHPVLILVLLTLNIVFFTLFLPVMLLGVSGYFLLLQDLEDPWENQKMFLVVKTPKNCNFCINQIYIAKKF